MTKIALVTGGGSGIGKACALKLAENGYTVIVTGRRQDALDDTVAAMGGGHGMAGDVTDAEQVDALDARISKDLGRLDVLFNNAGSGSYGIQELMSPEDMARVFDVNVTGVQRVMRAALPHMRAQGGGSVLTISSGAAHNAIEAWSHYCASKAGAAMLTRSLDLEERSHGIRAIGLSPGTVATQMQREIKASGINPVSQLNWEDHIPADWPAKTLLWMCTSEADAFLGGEISLRDPDIRQKVGLI